MNFFGGKELTLKVMASTGQMSVADIEQIYLNEGYCFVCGNGNVQSVEKEMN